MNYYRIDDEDVQFTNCKYLLKYYPKNRIIIKQQDYKIIFKDDFEYTVKPELYNKLTGLKTSRNEDAQQL